MLKLTWHMLGFVFIYEHVHSYLFVTGYIYEQDWMKNELLLQHLFKKQRQRKMASPACIHASHIASCLPSKYILVKSNNIHNGPTKVIPNKKTRTIIILFIVWQRKKIFVSLCPHLHL